MQTLQTTTLVAAAAALGFVAAGCGGTDGDGECTGPRILPDASPIVLGEMYPPPSNEDDENLGDNTRAPVERTILLESTCQETLEIQETCLVGEEDGGGGNDAEQFQIEGPTKTTVPGDEESAVRVTYERSMPNDGGDIDNVSLVVQSNAKNFPTLVVPICARVVKEGKDPSAISCTSPVEAPEKGNEKSGVCNN